MKSAAFNMSGDLQPSTDWNKKHRFKNFLINLIVNENSGSIHFLSISYENVWAHSHYFPLSAYSPYVNGIR